MRISLLTKPFIPTPFYAVVVVVVVVAVVVDIVIVCFCFLFFTGDQLYIGWPV